LSNTSSVIPLCNLDTFDPLPQLNRCVVIVDGKFSGFDIAAHLRVRNSSIMPRFWSDVMAAPLFRREKERVPYCSGAVPTAEIRACHTVFVAPKLNAGGSSAKANQE
jgi:hypothetical protein